MAIEIRELIIKATVSEEKNGAAKSSKNTAGKEDIVRECVDKVIEILKYEKGR